MAFACRLDQPSEVIATHLGADAGPDPWGGGMLHVGQFAPVIVRAGNSGRKLIRPMHWGYPAPGQSTEMLPTSEMRWVGHARNLESPFWIGNLRHVGLRCLIPLTSFVLQGNRRRPSQRCRVRTAPMFAVAGIWRDLTDMPVFAMLTTDPCPALLPVEGGAAPSSMPAILDAAGQERWLRADWKDAGALIAPYRGADFVVEEIG